MIKTERGAYGEIAPREKPPPSEERLSEPERIPTFAGLVAAAATWGVLENAEVLGLRELTEKAALAIQHSLYFGG